MLAGENDMFSDDPRRHFLKKVLKFDQVTKGDRRELLKGSVLNRVDLTIKSGKRDPTNLKAD